MLSGSPASWGHPPLGPVPPQRRRIRERFTVEEEEVRGSSFDDSPGLRFPEKLPAEDRRARECLPRLEARFDERLDLPREVVRAQGSSAKVCPSRNPHAGPVSEVYALDRPLPPTRDPLLPFVTDEPGQRRRLGEGGPGTEDRQGAHAERPLPGHLRDRVRVEPDSGF